MAVDPPAKIIVLLGPISHFPQISVLNRNPLTQAAYLTLCRYGALELVGEFPDAGVQTLNLLLPPVRQTGDILLLGSANEIIFMI